MMSIREKFLATFAFICIVLSLVLKVIPAQATVQEGQIAPPKIMLTDPHEVDVKSQQPTISVNTVAIGGERGLQHSISLYTSHFALTNGAFGYTDKFAGGATYTQVASDGAQYAQYGADWEPRKIFGMRVFGPTGTEDFKIFHNNQWVIDNTPGISANYRYEALGDTRNTLEIISTGLKWTQPDGTEIHFKRGMSPPSTIYANTGGIIEKIIYPNGLTLDIKFGNVLSNTGFQLKYLYQQNSGALSTQKQAILATLPSNHWVPPVGGFYEANPKWVQGVNRAYMFCSDDWQLNNSCSTSQYQWPTATFYWPNGMPRAIYLGDTDVKIESADNEATELRFRSYDVMLNELGQYVGQLPNGQYYPYQPRQVWSPRLIAVKLPGSTTFNREYEYKNVHIYSSQGPIKLVPFEGQLKRSSSTGETVNYPVLDQQGGYSIKKAYWHFGNYEIRPFTAGTHLGNMREAVIPKDGIYTFEENFRNFVKTYMPVSGPGVVYEYDNRGNLYKKITSGDGQTQVIEANYPSSCANKKTCNKPTWIKDARGNITEYEYDSASGQVTKVTGPANELGIRPQARYFYTPLKARYYKSNGVLGDADTPVYLLTKESTCRATSASSTGCAGGAADEIVTDYYYGPTNAPNNLLLRGKSVTAQGSSGLETRVTCYEYDVYGNQIGEISPQGNLSKTNANQCP